MLEELINAVKSEVGGQLNEGVSLPQGSIDNVLSVIGDVAKKEVTGQMLGGNLSDVMNLFSDKPNNAGANLLQSNISSGAISNLTSRLGLSPEISKNVAGVVIPALIKLITSKNNATPADDPSPLHEIFGTGGQGGLLGAAEGMLGNLLK